MGRHLELKDMTVKNQRINVQDVKNMYLVAEFIKCLTDEKAFGHAVKCHAHPKLMNELG